MHNAPAVDITSISHHYGSRTALKAVSFSVKQGHLFGLLGPNGGGKTTLFRVLSTLVQPAQGTASVFGHDTVMEPHAVRQELGVIFQQPALDDELTVLENLRFHGALYGLHGAALQSRIQEVMHQFSLTDRAQDRIKTLSGGLQRRTDLARGLLHHPKLLLLDEPTTGLDPIARRDFWSILARLRRQEGVTMMVATHLLEEAEACDEIGILHEGTLVTAGAPSALKAALGGETLWIETENPDFVCDQIETSLGLAARIVGRTVQISHESAPAVLSSVYEVAGQLIESATVRKPTLEDVFAVHTGHRIDIDSTLEKSIA